MNTNTLYSQSKYKTRNSQELAINRFYVRYGGVQKPQPDLDPSFSESGNVDRLVELWRRNLLHLGLDEFSNDTESLKEWRDRGIYIHLPFPKTGTDRSTRAYVRSVFSALVDSAGSAITPRLLLFNYYKKLLAIKMDNGEVQEVHLNEA